MDSSDSEGELDFTPDHDMGSGDDSPDSGDDSPAEADQPAPADPAPGDDDQPAVNQPAANDPPPISNILPAVFYACALSNIRFSYELPNVSPAVAPRYSDTHPFIFFTWIATLRPSDIAALLREPLWRAYAERVRARHSVALLMNGSVRGNRVPPRALCWFGYIDAEYNLSRFTALDFYNWITDLTSTIVHVSAEIRVAVRYPQ